MSTAIPHPSDSASVRPAPYRQAAGYSDRLTNEDLAPVPAEKRTWGAYNMFAMWMSDVHSVGGYVFAASLFATGLTGWQVLLGMLVGILMVYVLINWVGKPSQRLGVPYPVAARMAFGVFGANLPAIVRAVVAIAWYGVQTHFASLALKLLLLKFFPSLQAYAVDAQGFGGLSALGWACYIAMWTLQLLIFYRGMESIRKFIDFAGPAVYVVMFLMAIWVVYKVGLGNINLSLTDKRLSGSDAWIETAKVAALVVGYFSALLLNFGDFSRYCPTEKQMVRGNVLGLPINWMLFAIVTVIVTSGTVPLFGSAIMDPVEVVSRLDNVTAVVLGSLTFIIATLGINIVANFVSPAFDLSNVAPSKISFRMGGLITALITLFTFPWHFVNSPHAITLFVGTIGGFLGPLYGIMVVDYYLIKKEKIKLADLYSESKTGQFWYVNGWNMAAVMSLVPAVIVSAIIAFTPSLGSLAPVNWFISAAIGAGLYFMLAKRS
ncbi:MAG: permease for cytosine/purines uracil thiamine allantoin [Rhizobacter sp.]|nr:permease for cytosine/purines uracil thiamine allantoin [Rhizobacter sp.]